MTRYCTACGQVCPPSKGTKPRTFCSVHCQSVFHHLQRVETLLDDPAFDPTHERIKEVRAQLWAMANVLNTKASNLADVPERREAVSEPSDRAISTGDAKDIGSRSKLVVLPSAFPVKTLIQ